MRRLLKVTAMTGLLTLIKMAMGFVIAKIVAIYAGPTGMAMLGQVQSLVNGFNGIINAPTGNSVVRFTAENANKEYIDSSPWWRASLQWVFFLSVLIIPMGYIFSENIAELVFHDKSLSWVVVSTVISLPLTAFGTFIISVINGLQHYQRYIITGMVSAVISGIIVIGMIIYGGLKGALLALSIQYAIIAIVAVVINLNQPWLRSVFLWGKTSKAAKKDIVSYMVMAITSAVCSPVAMIVIRNILIEKVGWTQTGEWQAVWKISEVYLGVITMALGAYYLPRLSQLNSSNLIKVEIYNTSRIIVPIVFLLALWVYFFRDLAITILFTEEFRPARDLFLIQLIGDVVKIASWLFAYPMISRKATKWFISTEIVFSLTWVLLTYLFVISYGIHGANYAYLINYTLYFLFVFINVGRFSK